MSDRWRKRVRSGIQGTAEVIFPENDFGAPDWRSTDLVERTLAYLAELPPHRGSVVSALFIAADVALPPLMRDLRPLSRVPLGRRREAFDRWYAEPFSPLGQIVGALKATLSMNYFGHRDVVNHIGTVKPCDRPWDSYEVDIDVNALTRKRGASS